MIIIGLTGGIGVGKSTVCKLFENLKIPVIYADKIGHKLILKNQPSFEIILNHLGNNYLNNNGEINRKKLRELIFNSKAEKKWLENLLHPLISKEIIKLITDIKQQQNNIPYCIVEIPLLLETNSQNFKSLVNKILIITCSSELQITRVCQRDNISKAQALKIIQTQADNRLRENTGFDIIKNNGNLEDLKEKILLYHKKI